MNKLRAVKGLLHDTYNKCFGFITPNQDMKEYEKVEEASIPDTMKKADEDVNSDEVEATEWSTQDSIYQNQNSEGRITPSGKDKKKNVLIGNINEDIKPRKKDDTTNADDDLFQDMDKPTFNQKIQIGKNSKKSTNLSIPSLSDIQHNEKFSMDEDLEPEQGWGDSNIELN